MQRTALAATFLLVCAALLPACGHQKEDGDGRLTLTLFHWMEKDRTLWEEQVIAPFEKAHPTIHVVLASAPYGMYVSRAMTSIASGVRIADLMFAEDWFGQELIDRGYARNLMPVARRDLHLEEFFEDAFREWKGVAQKPDELFGFPAAIGVTVLCYNKDLFDKAGIAYPDSTWTYDDLVRAGERLTIDRDGDGTPDQWGLSLDVHYTGLETIIYSQGGRVLTDDLSRAALTEPATIEAFRFVRDLFQKYRIAPATSSIMTPWEQFVSGKAAMIMIGSHGSMHLVETRLRWGLAMPPKGKDGRRVSRRYSMAFLIPRNSEHPDEAWELLKWILTKSPVETIDRQYMAMMPSTRAYVRSPVWRRAQQNFDRGLLVELADRYSLPLFTPGWQEWRDQCLTPNLTLVIRGAKSVEEFAVETEEQINAILERRRDEAL